MGVEVIDLAMLVALHRHAHAAHRAFAGGGDHVGAVGGHPVADQFGMDACAARDRMVPVLQHQHAAAAGDHEAVAIGIVGARGLLWAIVERGRQRAHRIEHHAHRPVQVLATTGEDDVLGAVADQVGGRADAVRRGRAGGADRIGDALDLERGGQVGRHGRAHRARDHVRTDLAHAARAQDVGGLHLPVAGTAAGAGDQAGAWVADLGLVQARVGDRVTHRHIAVGGRIAHEALELAVDHRLQVQLHRAADLAAQALLGVVGQEADAGAAVAQRRRYRVQVVAQARSDTHAGDGDAAVHLRNPRWR